ncbi:MAG: hypothetical protein ACOYOU_18710 [Kiritimatiellia bacterium]
MIICNLTNLLLAYKCVCERMHHANTKPARMKAKKKTWSRKSQHPGITRAAKDMGVSHSHLWRVLSGERQSRVLTQRYLAWRRSA